MFIPNSLTIPSPILPPGNHKFRVHTLLAVFPSSLPSLPDSLLGFSSLPRWSPGMQILISGSASGGMKAKTRLAQEFCFLPFSPLASSTEKSHHWTDSLLKPQLNAFMLWETSFLFTILAFFRTNRARGSIIRLPSYSWQTFWISKLEISRTRGQPSTLQGLR